MKKLLGFICFVCLMLMMVSCAPHNWFLMNSEGIFTYDRYTGKVELVWETKSAMIHNQDSVRQSCKNEADSIPHK